MALMLDELRLLHIPRVSDAARTDNQLWRQALQWQTCLRRLVILHQDALPSHLNLGFDPRFDPKFDPRFDPRFNKAGARREIYRAASAYQFLLEIICGLHSPLLGETEVLGQFREFYLAAPFPENHWGNFLRQLTGDLLRDAKRIRRQYLQHLGHRSYGSHASQWLHSLPVLGVLGAGQLVGELAPWLTAQATVRVFARNPARAAAALGEQQNLQVHGLSDHATPGWPNAQSGLIIAAPLAAQEIYAWIERQGASFARVLDLRGEAVNDPLPKAVLAGTEIMALQEFFAGLRQERQRGEKRATLARVAIAQAAQRQLRQTQYRPYGWEDLCA